MMTFVLKLLSKTPAGKFIIEKFRLFVEYLLIAAVITLCGVTFTMWVQKEVTEKELVVVKGRLKTVEEVNENQERTIASLKDLRQRDGEAFLTLMGDYRVLAKRDKVARARLDKLEKENATVQAHFNLPVPAELRCLHNSCPADQTGSDQGKAP